MHARFRTHDSPAGAPHPTRRAASSPPAPPTPPGAMGPVTHTPPGAVGPAGRTAGRPPGARAAVLALVLLLAPASPRALAAQDQGHSHGPGDARAQEHGHSHGLHFTHPLFAESVSPDTKLRLDFSSADAAGERASELEFEGEYAFARYFSVEAGVHFEPEGGELGETHLIAKFANYALEEAGLLLGYGLELGLPTGTAHAHGGEGEHEDGHHHAHGHGHPDEHDGAEEPDDVVKVTPFLNVGWLAGRWELVGWTLFEIPADRDAAGTAGAELRYHASVLFHATPRLDALLEAFGASGLSGPDGERTVANLAPGLRVRPLGGRPLVFGAALAVPLADDRDFDTRVLVSAFYHF